MNGEEEEEGRGTLSIADTHDNKDIIRKTFVINHSYIPINGEQLLVIQRIIMKSISFSYIEGKAKNVFYMG